MMRGVMLRTMRQPVWSFHDVGAHMARTTEASKNSYEHGQLNLQMDDIHLTQHFLLESWYGITTQRGRGEKVTISLKLVVYIYNAHLWMSSFGLDAEVGV